MSTRRESILKTEEEVVIYFRNYHNVHTRGEFFQQINNALMQNSFSNLSRDEAFALWGYTTNFFYKDLNAWVRTGANAQKTAEIAALLR